MAILAPLDWRNDIQRLTKRWPTAYIYDVRPFIAGYLGQGELLQLDWTSNIRPKKALPNLCLALLGTKP